MMKKVMLFITSALTAVMLTACGTSAEKTEQPVSVSEAQNKEETEAPLDLTGQWRQQVDGDSYMAAVIQEDKIGVFFILEGDEEPWTYWVGTYDAPQNNTEEYSWTSTSTYGGSGILASSDSEKNFEYKNGKLTYKVTMNGETKEVSLEKGEWDTSKIPASAFGSVNAENEEVLPLEIKESSWIVKDGQWLYYFVRLYNPNEDIAVEYPSFRITARDNAGVVLGTEDQTCSIIYPQQDFVWGSQAFEVDEQPETVDFEVLKAEDYNLKRGSSLEPYVPLEAVNTAIRSGKIVGEIENKNGRNFDTVAVLVVLKNASGEIVDICNTFVNDVAENGTSPFEIGVSDNGEIVSYEVYLNQW